jgi:hypothetical protein
VVDKEQVITTPDLAAVAEAAPGDDGSPDEAASRPAPPRSARSRLRRHRVKLGLLAALVLALLVPGCSFVRAMEAPGNLTASEKAVEWLRDNGFNGPVNGVENWWYTSHPPPTGGRPARAITAVGLPTQHGHLSRVKTPAVVTVAHTPLPANVVSPVSDPLPNEGVWIPVGPRVDGFPTMEETQVRPDAVHTSLLDGLVWMDPRLVRFELHPGLSEPGGSWNVPSEIPIADRLNLVAAFNSGFRMRDARGGFSLDGVTARPLVDGAASFVIDKDGSATVGSWGRDVQMGPNVVAVRQNLQLIVDGGQLVPGLSDNLNGAWGQTLGQKVLVWRSAVCVDAHGGVIFGYGNGLGALSLAELMQRAGCQRAMELDINSSWTTFNFYAPVEAGNPASVLGTKMLADQRKPGDRYLAPDARDFIAVFQR